MPRARPPRRLPSVFFMRHAAAALPLLLLPVLFPLVVAAHSAAASAALRQHLIHATAEDGSPQPPVKYVGASERYIGLGLAVLSSLLIGSSFIFTKLGLNAASSNPRGSVSLGSETALAEHPPRPKGAGYRYLKNGKWWAGMIAMVCGEGANFAAYSFAPAILVTPLGALSVLISAVLASFFLGEKLKKEGYIGCALCLLGSVIIVTHAPEEKEIESVDEIMQMAMNPFFLTYALLAIGGSIYLIRRVVPVHGRRNILVYITICSLVGSISVMAVKAFAVALKLSLQGNNQFKHFSTYLLLVVVISAAVTQINYFNKSLELFSTNLVTPIYYVLFTTSTIIASLALLGAEGMQTSATNLISSFCGFGIIFIGVFMLNMSPGATRKASGIPMADIDTAAKRISSSNILNQASGAPPDAFETQKATLIRTINSRQNLNESFSEDPFASGGPLLPEQNGLLSPRNSQLNSDNQENLSTLKI